MSSASRLPLRILARASTQALRTPFRPQPHLFQARFGGAQVVASPAVRAFHPSPFQLLDQAAVDAKMEELNNLYATAKDEFEIAAEETAAKTIYAEEDRTAAREELTKLQEAFKEAVEGPDKELAEEVKRRVGQRIRELENAVAAMEESAMED